MKIVITITPAFIAAVTALIVGLVGRKMLTVEEAEATQ